MTAAVKAPIAAERLSIVPANRASWDDLAAVFGTAGYPSRCQCQRYKVAGCFWRDSVQEQRTAYPKLRTSRIPWSGRDEGRDDQGVWAVTCFVVRKGYRGRGLTYSLAHAAIDHARERGARALEAYPMITVPGREITWGEVHVGARQSTRRQGSRRSAIPPPGGWSCGSSSGAGGQSEGRGQTGPPPVPGGPLPLDRPWKEQFLAPLARLRTIAAPAVSRCPRP